MLHHVVCVFLGNARAYMCCPVSLFVVACFVLALFSVVSSTSGMCVCCYCGMMIDTFTSVSCSFPFGVCVAEFVSTSLCVRLLLLRSGSCVVL